MKANLLYQIFKIIYPHLIKYGAKLPQFKKKDLKSLPELQGIHPLWIKIIDGLTNLDPLSRMPVNRAIDLVKEIQFLR